MKPNTNYIFVVLVIIAIIVIIVCLTQNKFSNNQKMLAVQKFVNDKINSFKLPFNSIPEFMDIVEKAHTKGDYHKKQQYYAALLLTFIHQKSPGTISKTFNEIQKQKSLNKIPNNVIVGDNIVPGDNTIINILNSNLSKKHSLLDAKELHDKKHLKLLPTAGNPQQVIQNVYNNVSEFLGASYGGTKQALTCLWDMVTCVTQVGITAHGCVDCYEFLTTALFAGPTLGPLGFLFVFIAAAVFCADCGLTLKEATELGHEVCDHPESWDVFARALCNCTNLDKDCWNTYTDCEGCHNTEYQPPFIDVGGILCCGDGRCKGSKCPCCRDESHYTSTCDPGQHRCTFNMEGQNDRFTDRNVDAYGKPQHNKATPCYNPVMNDGQGGPWMTTDGVMKSHVPNPPPYSAETDPYPARNDPNRGYYHFNKCVSPKITMDSKWPSQQHTTPFAHQCQDNAAGLMTGVPNAYYTWSDAAKAWGLYGTNPPGVNEVNLSGFPVASTGACGAIYDYAIISQCSPTAGGWGHPPGNSTTCSANCHAKSAMLYGPTAPNTYYGPTADQYGVQYCNAASGWFGSVCDEQYKYGPLYDNMCPWYG